MLDTVKLYSQECTLEVIKCRQIEEGYKPVRLKIASYNSDGFGKDGINFKEVLMRTRGREPHIICI